MSFLFLSVPSLSFLLFCFVLHSLLIFYPSIYPSIHPSIQTSIHPSIHLSIHPSIHSSIYFPSHPLSSPTSIPPLSTLPLHSPIPSSLPPLSIILSLLMLFCFSPFFEVKNSLLHFTLFFGIRDSRFRRYFINLRKQYPRIMRSYIREDC
jgi:hypothetical protein